MFTITEEHEVKTIAQLKEEFYELTLVPRKEKKKAFKNIPDAYGPITIVQNPPGWGSPDDPLRPDFYIAIYYRRYYVKVECGQNIMEGPHKFELCFQVRKGCHVFLGCFTSCFAFFNEELIPIKLRKAIIQEKYFCTDKTAAQIIELGEINHKDETI